MIRKLLLAALVCVSVAQVHGGELEDTINSGLLQARGLYVTAKQRLEGAQSDIPQRKAHIAFLNFQVIFNGIKMGEDSRETLRAFANATEEEARKNGSPESVFRCISRNERRASRKINAYTNDLITRTEKLKENQHANMDIPAELYEALGHNLEETFISTCREMVSCQNTECVYKVFASYSIRLNSLHMVVGKTEDQVNAGVEAFRYQSTNYFDTANKQIGSTTAGGVKNILNCYDRRGIDMFFEEAEEAEETQNA